MFKFKNELFPFVFSSLLTRLFVEGGSCGAQSLMDRANELTGSLNDFIGRMRDSLNDFRDRVSNWWNSVQ